MDSDHSIIEQLKDGDITALETLICRHKRFVFTLCKNILKDNFEAEEATQDTFLKFYRSINRIELKAKLTTLLYKIAYRTSLDYIRKRKRVLSIEKVDLKHLQTETADSTIESNEKKKYLLEAISNLRTEESAILTLFYFKEMSIKEVAVITGLSISNVKVKLLRSRTKLETILKDNYQFLIPNNIYEK